MMRDDDVRSLGRPRIAPAREATAYAAGRLVGFGCILFAGVVVVAALVVFACLVVGA